MEAEMHFGMNGTPQINMHSKLCSELEAWYSNTQKLISDLNLNSCIIYTCTHEIEIKLEVMLELEVRKFLKSLMLLKHKI